MSHDRSAWATLVRVVAYRLFLNVLRWANDYEGIPTENASGVNKNMRALREHAMQRCVERYGIRFPKSFNIFVQREIVGALAGEHSKACRVPNQNRNRSLWEIEARQGRVYVIFDHGANEPITYLTRKMAESQIERYGRKAPTEAQLERLKNKYNKPKRSSYVDYKG